MKGAEDGVAGVPIHMKNREWDGRDTIDLTLTIKNEIGQ